MVPGSGLPSAPERSRQSIAIALGADRDQLTFTPREPRNRYTWHSWAPRSNSSQAVW